MTGLPFPALSPEVFSVTVFGVTLALRWYALAYILGMLAGWRLVLAAVRQPALWGGTSPMTAEQVEALFTWIVLGVVLGGRLGFVLFYQPGYYLQHPGQILAVWQGGMSFHGGFLGVVLAGWVFARRHGIAPGRLADALALAVPPGLLLGRIANFINAELWGRPTDLPWGVIFPGAAAQDCPGVLPGLCARHPSQLYEAALEGALLGAAILWLVWRRGALRRPWLVTGVFLAGYGAARVFVEHFRQADAQFITPDNPLGHVLRLGEAGLTMGQLLSLPMLGAGVALILWAGRRG
ncbi:MAG: prolipoprotein diacylglyceryl transferase [Rhodobacterales bacterium]|nr:prolipoprotein diacylglyceryl transferase [Rhodobacterales bacterium]